MGIIHRLAKRVSFPVASSLDNVINEKSSVIPRFAFFKRRIRLRRNSAISIPLGFVLLFPCIVIILIVLLIVTHPSSSGGILLPAGTPPSIRKISEKYDKVFATGCLEIDTSTPRANAAFVVLARNKELEGVIQSIKSIERHFNRFWHYPYVFLNDGDFEESFKASVRNYTSAPVEFGKIEHSMWGFPDWISPEVAKEGIRKQGDAAIMYEQNKTYGFTIAVKELRETVPNIFRYASAYKRSKNLKSKGLWEMFLEEPEEPEVPKRKPAEDSLPDEILQTSPGDRGIRDIDPEAMEGEKYNMCHFWSNFEIARLDWFRSKEYEDFFTMMDRSGGFWMERWGDAPIHSLAAGALLSPSDIHYFRDFGYRHTTIQHCPANAPARQRDRTPWLEMTTEDEKKRQEEDEYWDTPDPPKENGVGCRCRCDTDIDDVEGKQGSCLADWVKVAGGWASP
ncbi:O-glycoside alpha-1,2-mannosyltransferase 4 [Ophidiomyces ophidiicola]|nr:O-glycoside alpha-1,2-mannosyltransferase 4 [Ophidiomyces ophidiicola]KAI1958459.1 O-glycoside alpha-1,2-mannosyltransferase 4 [Ophidiomyces ophidiicola]